MSYPGVFGRSRFDGSRLRPGQEVRKRSRRDGSQASPLEKCDTLDNIEQSFKRRRHDCHASLRSIVTDDPKVASMRLRINAMAQRSIVAFRFTTFALRAGPPRTPM